MYGDRISFVIHTTDLERIGITEEAELQVVGPAGPLGFVRYTAAIQGLDTERLKEFNALSYYLVLPEEVIRLYSESDFLDMVKLYLGLKIGASPDSFHKIAFEERQERRYYPMYRGEHLYIGPQEAQLLNIDPLGLLGYYPVSGNSEVWNRITVHQPHLLEGACVVRSESLTPEQRDQIIFTLSELDWRMISNHSSKERVCSR
jgi:hypothetical protein